MFRSKKYPNSTANIDAILLMPNGKLAIFEAKTAARGKEGEWMGNKIPANYISQCHQYIAVLDDDRIEGAYIGMIPVADMTLDGTYIASAYNDDFYHHFLEPDKSYEEEIMENEQYFWETHIVNSIKPEKSKDPELDKQTMLRYQPSPLSDPSIPQQEVHFEPYTDLFDKLVKSEKAYKDAKKALDTLEKTRDSIRLDVIETMNGAKSAVYKDSLGEIKMAVKNSPVVKTSFDAYLLRDFYPEAYQAAKKESPYHKFTFKQY